MPQCMLGYTHPKDQTPLTRCPPGPDAPDQTPPTGPDTPPGADTPWTTPPLKHTPPWDQTPPGPNPLEQTPPWDQTPPPKSRHPPRADTPFPPDQTPPGADTPSQDQTTPPPKSTLWYMVNERPVRRILLECILVKKCYYTGNLPPMCLRGKMLLHHFGF